MKIFQHFLIRLAVAIVDGRQAIKQIPAPSRTKITLEAQMTAKQNDPKGLTINPACLVSPSLLAGRDFRFCFFPASSYRLQGFIRNF
jgi:hypothetical protein